MEMIGRVTVMQNISFFIFLALEKSSLLSIIKNIKKEMVGTKSLSRLTAPALFR